MCPFIPDFRIFPTMNAANKKEVLREFAAAVHDELPELTAERLFSALSEREDIGSTGIGDGLAIPHAKINELSEIIVYFGRSPKGVPFDAQDGKPVHLFFLLLAPVDAAETYLSCLARLARLVKIPSARAQLLAARDEREIGAVFAESL